MKPKVTKLRRKSESFPSEKSEGDLVINVYNEIFMFAGGQWILLGGRFLDFNAINIIIQYLQSGLAGSDIVYEDLSYLLDDYLNRPLPSKEQQYAHNSRKWYDIFLNNLIKALDLVNQ